MCLHDVGRTAVVDPVSGTATVDVDGRRTEVSLLALESADGLRAGDWVVIYHGYVIEVLDDEQARTLLATRRELVATNDPTEGRS